MNELMEQIKKKDARAFTHGGKFHADCRLPRLLTQQGLTTIERVDDAG